MKCNPSARGKKRRANGLENGYSALTAAKASPNIDLIFNSFHFSADKTSENGRRNV